MARMKRTANGSGCIRLRKDGRWEGIYSIPATDGAGKYVRKSVYGKTQEDVRKKLTKITSEIDSGTYVAPSKMKLSEWLDTWLRDYVKFSVKNYTLETYQSLCDKHIKRVIGNKTLTSITVSDIQRFYNGLLTENGLSTKTVKNIHGVLHRALEQAVTAGLIKENPSRRCSLPKTERKAIKPLESEEISRFIEAIKGHKYENIFFVTLFSGLRESEVLALTWDCVDFENNLLLINKQLVTSTHHTGPTYSLGPTKNSKSRYVTVAPSVMTVLKKQKELQNEWSEKASGAWDNAWNLVFTNELGEHLKQNAIYKAFKKEVTSIGLPSTRYHDLRHSYAVASIESGDDIKTVQSNLGHATASFTLDVYGHVSRKMQMKSAENMEKYIINVS